MPKIKHALKDRLDDCYQTPPEAVRALMRVEKLPHVLWDASCGPGSIVRVLRAAGHQVYATDLVDYNSPDQDCAKWDFLSERQLPIGVQAIIQNPPFKLAAEFIEHSLKLCPKVYMLLRLAFLESERRTSILDNGTLARVYVFKNRLPLMHREGWTGKRASNAICFAWMVFDSSHKGPTELHRISWTRES